MPLTYPLPITTMYRQVDQLIDKRLNCLTHEIVKKNPINNTHPDKSLKTESAIQSKFVVIQRIFSEDP